MYYHNVGMRGSRGGGGSRGPDPPPPRKIQISKFNIHCKITENIPRNPTPPPLHWKMFLDPRMVGQRKF